MTPLFVIEELYKKSRKDYPPNRNEINEKHLDLSRLRARYRSTSLDFETTSSNRSL